MFGYHGWASIHPSPGEDGLDRPLDATSPTRGGARLIVLRGNSGSGKSTVAGDVQARFPKGRCAIVAQDVVRRTMLRESDVRDGFNVSLIETIATACLERVDVVIVEGILGADRYAGMLERLARRTEHPLFYAWDLSFEETARRHARRPQADEFTVADMRAWYHGWQPLPFVDEMRFDATWSRESTVERILSDLVRTPGSGVCPEP